MNSDNENRDLDLRTTPHQFRANGFGWTIVVIAVIMSIALGLYYWF